MTAPRAATILLGIGALSLLVNASVAAVGGIPRPAVHDEFSYLLAADTFARGRLTNPAHPLWEHFESIHIIQQPTYQSKFPPGQGLLLAAGQALTGYPIAGVWLATAVASAAVGWTLLSCLPLPWAAFGGLLTALHPLMLRWSQSYFGGSLAVLGGALLVGGAERLTRQRRAGWALAMSAGIALLAVTRPFEGLVFTVLVVGRLGIWVLGQPDRGALAARLGLLLAVVVAPTLAWVGYYNYRVTGHAAKPPYLAYMEQYQAAPVFVWEKVPPPKEYRHDAIRAFHRGWELAPALARRSPLGLLRDTAMRLLELGRRYSVRGVLALLLLGLAGALRRDPRLRGGVVILGLFTLALLAPAWAFPHYAAPAFGLLVLVLTASAASLWDRRWRGVRAGRVIVCVVAAVYAGALVRAAVIEALAPPHLWTAQRARITAEILAQAPRSLVMVRYGARKDVQVEWVYNGADLDGADIVWARSMTPEADRQLLDYFRGRAVWNLTVERRAVTLTPGTPASAAPRATSPRAR